ncbi:Zn(II)2Cys6 transcription factor protein [Rutstroemia sp. NJR-2017a BBW]|nr:Zn(II)2Cys6 transcription factor protein [Rutstroemia sp. NJR-2017a BBW]
MQSTVEAGPKVSRHGKACINCARAKVKCVEQSIGACHRLNKDCQPITRVQRRKPAKKTTAAKTAELEEKLDGLVSLLAAATQQQLTPPESTAPYQSTTSEISSNSQAFQCQIGTNPPLDAIKSLQNAAAIQLNLPANSPYRILSTPSSLPAPGLPGNPGSSSIPQGTIPSVSLIPPELELSPAEEEAALQSFRSYSKKYFPFIQIPEQTTAQKFREESPFLSLTIMMAMAKSTQRQMSLAIHIRQLIGKKLLVDGERDLDLLFGLMTFGTMPLPAKTYGHYQCITTGPCWFMICCIPLESYPDDS